MSGDPASGAAVQGYRLIGHTADAGLIAWGPTPGAAFVAAAEGMYALILGADPRAVLGPSPDATADLAVDGANWDELLVNFLAELLFRFEVDAFVATEIRVTRCLPPACTAHLVGYRVEGTAPLGRALKAVTYHQLAVRPGAKRTEVQVVFDV